MKLVAALFVFALASCSSSGNPYGNGGNAAKGTPGQAAPGQATAPGSASGLIGHAWCLNSESQGVQYQARLNFINTEDYDVHVFSLTPEGRGPELQQSASQGNYEINGDSITLRPNNGQPVTGAIRLDPQDATTGAAKLHIGDSAFDPCI